MYKYLHVFPASDQQDAPKTAYRHGTSMGTFSGEPERFPKHKQIDITAPEPGRRGRSAAAGGARYTTNKTDPWIDYVTIAGTDEQIWG